MSTKVNLNELFTAYEWVSAGEAAALDCEAYISRKTGEIHWSGEGVEEPLPEDVDDEGLYVAVPHKSEFDLGRSLAIRFVEEHLPGSLESVHEYFRRRGAYSRFKALLVHAGQLEAWHRYEQAATEEALRRWCEEHGLMPC